MTVITRVLIIYVYILLCPGLWWLWSLERGWKVLCTTRSVVETFTRHSLVNSGSKQLLWCFVWGCDLWLWHLQWAVSYVLNPTENWPHIQEPRHFLHSPTWPPTPKPQQVQQHSMKRTAKWTPPNNLIIIESILHAFCVGQNDTISKYLYIVVHGIFTRLIINWLKYYPINKT